MQNPLLFGVRRPRAALAVVGVLTGLFLLPLLAGKRISALVGHPIGLRLEFKVENLFPQADPRLDGYHAFKEAFGPDDRVAVVLLETAEDVLAEPFMRRCHALTETLREHPLVDADRVVSLTHVTYTRSRDDWLAVEPLFDPGQTYDVEAVASALPGHPLYENRVFSADRRIAAFLVPIHPQEDTPKNRRAFARDLKQTFDDAAGEGDRAWLDGVIVVRHSIMGLMRRDASLYYPLAFVLLVVILGVWFRRVAATALATAVVVLCSLWTLGGMAWVGIPINLISTAIPVILVVAGVGDAVHLLTRYRQLLAEGQEQRPALEEAVREVGLACFLTSVTTAIGFWSLALSDVTMIRELGLPIGFGVLCAFLITLTLLPPVLGWLKPPAPRPDQAAGIGERVAGWIWRVVTAHRVKVLVASALALLAALAVATRIRVESRMLGDFGPESPLVQTREFMEDRFGGVSALEVFVTAPVTTQSEAPDDEEEVEEPPTRLLEADALGGVDRLAAALRSAPFQERGVLRVLALTDFLKDMNHVLLERAEGTNVLPDTRQAVAQYLLLYEGAAPSDPTSDYLHPDRDRLRVQVRIRNLRTPEFFALVDAVRAAATEHLPGDLDVEITGNTLMLQAAHQSLVRNLVQSLGLALLAVFVSVLVSSRSLKLALLGLIPNLLPLVCCLALLAAAGIELRLATSVIFCMVFGIAVDDTIHFLSALHARRHLDPREQVERALRETGAALVGTTAILVAGFSVLLLSAVQGNRIIGAMCAATLVIALLADLVVLTALLLPRAEPDA